MSNDKFEPIVLSHNDTQAFNELTRDKMAARAVYDAASERFHNALREIDESSEKLWAHLHETYGLDESVEYIAKFDIKYRRSVITKKPEEQ